MDPTIRTPSAAPEIVLIPKDYMLGPVFAAKPQTQPRHVQIGKKIYEVGCGHPLRPDTKQPALDIRHGRALVVLLSFRDTLNPQRIVRFSLNEFAHRYAASNGGTYARHINRLLADWVDTWISVTNAETRHVKFYRALDDVIVEGRPPRKRDALLANSAQLELWLSGAQLTKEFSELLSHIDELQHIKMEALLSISSPLAQSIYWYIPSRAVHHSEDAPFEISVSNLLTQVAFPIPKPKAHRRTLFTQNKDRSILAQLDGKETLSGKVFRVRLVETADKTDWKLLAWVEGKEKGAGEKVALKPKSKLLTAFLAAGHTREEANDRLARISPLTDYETDLLERGQIKVPGNKRFFEVAKALLGQVRFDSLLAEAKGEVAEGNKPTKSTTARLIYRIVDAISSK